MFKQAFTGALVATTLLALPAVLTQPADAFKTKPVTAGTTIKSGTTVNGKIDVTLDSGKATDGDTFTMVIKPGMFQDKTLKGAILEGHVEGVKSAAKMGKKGELDVMFDDIKTLDGKVTPISAMLASAPQASGTKLRTMALMLGGAVAGHHIGKSTGKTKHGALLGAVAGGAVALAMPGGQVVISKGTELKVKFTSTVNL